MHAADCWPRECALLHYIWQQSKEGRPVKEEPLKVHDHGMDAMRYLVMQLDNAVPITVTSIPLGGRRPALVAPEDAYRRRLHDFMTGADLR